MMRQRSSVNQNKMKGLISCHAEAEPVKEESSHDLSSSAPSESLSDTIYSSDCSKDSKQAADYLKIPTSMKH